MHPVFFVHCRPTVPHLPLSLHSKLDKFLNIYQKKRGAEIYQLCHPVKLISRFPPLPSQKYHRKLFKKTVFWCGSCVRRIQFQNRRRRSIPYFTSRWFWIPLVPYVPLFLRLTGSTSNQFTKVLAKMFSNV